MQTWNPDQYNRFKQQRTQPFLDLMSMVKGRNKKQGVDLGCGTGELTRLLADTLHFENFLGVDTSAEMLEKSKAFTRPGLQFQAADIAKFKPTTDVDLILSNAALQWVPDHEVLFPKILSWIRPGGEVAIQMPSNFDHPSHRFCTNMAFKSKMFAFRFMVTPCLREKTSWSGPRDLC
jgi:trans-aconitate 2-methyltransferase